MKKIFLILVCLTTIALGQPISSKQIDSIAELTLKTFNVPGIAVGVVKDGKLIHAKGYGVRSVITKEKVDENTLFGIASNSKAFTAAALAMLVDEKKLNWDDKVTKYIPRFKLYNPWVTEEFTVRDLICHRSGLDLGAGDLMMWPDSNVYSKTDIIEHLQYLKPVSSFRSKYDYNNNLFIVAGEVIAAVSGMTWEEFIEQRIMKPLDMKKSAASRSRLKDKSNITEPHIPVNGTLQVSNIHWSETANAAGGIYTSINDLSKWVIMQLNRGTYGNDNKEKLFSPERQMEMWSIQTPLPIYNPGYYETYFNGYGLGWFVSSVKGQRQIGHTGGLAGIVTQVTLFPELGLGIMVFTNQQVGAAFTCITNSIKDAYLGLPPKNWIKELSERVNKLHADSKKIEEDVWKQVESQQKNRMLKPDVANYTGNYKDNWFGEVTLTSQNGKFLFASQNSKRMRGELFYYKANTWVIKWNDRSFDADAFVHFTLDKNGKATGFKMEAFLPITDFSFDFQDLEFFKTEK